jgi:hypothetical protein
MSCRELREVVLFEVLDNGYKRTYAKQFLLTGNADPPHCGCCKDKCGIYSGICAKTFLQVRKDSIVRFLESHHFSREILSIANGDNVVHVLWKGKR